jgi:hypothetical protein
MFAIYGPISRRQCLRKHLPAENMLTVMVLPAKKIFFNGFDIKEVDDFLQYFIHKISRIKDMVGIITKRANSPMLAVTHVHAPQNNTLFCAYAVIV